MSCSLWSPYVIGQTIIFLPYDFYLLLSSFFPRLISAVGDWMSTILAHMETNSLSSNISPTCPRNMVNFGPLMAEIVSLVWGTPANFNGFCVLAALLHGTPAVGVSQNAALNRGRHLYSAGRPSRWALAHISSFFFFFSLPNISGRRLDVCHTCTHGVALVRI